MIDMDELDEMDPVEAKPLGRKPRIACLHGGGGNEFIFRSQLAPLIKRLGDEVELVFLEGKHLSDEVRFDERGKKTIETLRAVFGADQALREHAVTKYGELGDAGPFYYDRLDEGIEHSEATLRAVAPIDALLGFSQGANFSTMLCSRAEKCLEGAAAPFRCMVLLENDLAGWPEQKPELFAEPLSTPALVVGGHKESKAADRIEEMFVDVETFRHEDGHRPLPRNKKALDEFVDMARDWIFKHCPP